MYRLRIIYRYFMQLGFEPLKLISGIKALFRFIPNYFEFKKNKDKRFPLKCSFPCLHDKNDDAGVCKGHYFHQDLIIAQEIFKENPEKHVDIASRIDGFVAHVATFREIEVLDIRNIDSKVKNIKFKQADLMNIGDNMINYTESISSLHAIEHFGLGRYGDSIDQNGHIKGLDNIYKMLKKNGIFYLAVPIGKQRIEFNAHRVFSIKYLYDYLLHKYKIEKFAYVDDEGNLHKGINIEDGFNENFGCWFGCGIFKLRKI